MPSLAPGSCLRVEQALRRCFASWTQVIKHLKSHLKKNSYILSYQSCTQLSSDKTFSSPSLANYFSCNDQFQTVWNAQRSSQLGIPNDPHLWTTAQVPFNLYHDENFLWLWFWFHFFCLKCFLWQGVRLAPVGCPGVSGQLQNATKLNQKYFGQLFPTIWLLSDFFVPVVFTHSFSCWVTLWTVSSRTSECLDRTSVIIRGSTSCQGGVVLPTRKHI